MHLYTIVVLVVEMLENITSFRTGHCSVLYFSSEEAVQLLFVMKFVIIYSPLPPPLSTLFFCMGNCKVPCSFLILFVYKGTSVSPWLYSWSLLLSYILCIVCTGDPCRGKREVLSFCIMFVRNTNGKQYEQFIGSGG